MFGSGVAGVLRPRLTMDAGEGEGADLLRSSAVWSVPSSVRSARDEAYHSEKVSRQPTTEGNLKVSFSVECSEEVMCCTYNENGTLLAVGLVEGTIKIYSAETGAALYSLIDEEITSVYLPCTSLNFKPYAEEDKSVNILLATYASGIVKLWHLSTGQCLHTIHEPRQTLTASFQKKGQIFVTAGSDEKICIYDTATKTKIRDCQPSMSRHVMDGHRCRVFSIKFHPKEVSEFVSGGWDDTLQFWDVRQEHSLRKLYGPHICGDSLDIDVYHNHIVTGSWRKDNNVQIWDYDSGHNIKTLLPDITNSLLYCAQWLGRDRIVVGGCDANMVRVLDRGTLQTTGRLVDLPRGVYCLDNSKQGTVPKFVIGTSRSLYFLEVVQS
ncbi:Dynein assembly factor with WDR repeat domains 1 [Holothuria leucospilota]|uniref:Dynein assembly factor with WDR repeat domains 1 n=1 Tax=Holothuria leucospilota TaxID=206669 RepID=A0A9Q1CFK8_HOLLE|nr:Dynein assembly factor with WDR repeat domains 1 [Holothuria leucospilota]